MSISLSSTTLTNLRLGNSQVSAAYLGTSLVYQTSSVAPTPTSVIQLLSVSQSLWAYYDTAFTTSYSGSGQTGITDLSGNGNNGSVDASLVWKDILSGSSAPTNSMVIFNPDNAGYQINMPSVPAGSFTMLVSWYGKNFNYISQATEVFVGRDPEGYGIFNLENTYNYRTLNIVNDTYDSLTYMPVDSGTGSVWHVSAFSYNTSSRNINWCMDGTTGSYTLSSPGALSSFNPIWNKNSSGRYMGSGSMVQVLAFYTGSLTTDQLLQNYNGLKGRYI